jgi:hypothetical protein
METDACGTSGLLDFEVLDGLSSGSVRERSVNDLNTSSWALLPWRRSPPQGSGDPEAIWEVGCRRVLSKISS